MFSLTIFELSAFAEINDGGLFDTFTLTDHDVVGFDVPVSVA